jgi:hypothetical protein
MRIADVLCVCVCVCTSSLLQETNSLMIEHKGSTPLIPKSPAGHNPEAFANNSDPHNLFLQEPHYHIPPPASEASK